VIADHDVLEHGHRSEQGDVLKRPCQAVPDDVVGRNVRHRLPVDQNATGARPVHACDDVEKRGFARPVGPDEGHDLARVDGEGDAIQRNDPPEADAELAYVEQRHPRASL
jgi:hypothetical protein